MIPRTIHLVWLGPPNPVVDAAVAQWHNLGGGRGVRLHTDDAALLPELRTIWDYVAGHPRCPVLRSDLLRWSIMAAGGGWYFDCDLRSLKTLDKIEQDASAGPQQLILRATGGKASKLLTDAIGSPAGWPGIDPVIRYLAESAALLLPQLTMRWYPPWEVTWAWEHPEYFAVLPPAQYSATRCEPGKAVLQRNALTPRHVAFPPVRKQFAYYRTAMRRWRKAGRPKRPDAEVTRIFETLCKPCEWFTRGRCRVCGCRLNRGKRGLLNKIRMATEECPLVSPKWGRWLGR